MHIDFRAILKRLPHGDSRKAVNSLGWLMADKVFKLVVGAVVGILVIRYLGPARFGQWSLLLSWLLLITSIAPLGLDRIVIRNLATNPDARQTIIGSTLVLRLFAGIVLYAAFCLTVYWVAGPQMLGTACVCGGSLAIQAPYVLDQASTGKTIGWSAAAACGRTTPRRCSTSLCCQFPLHSATSPSILSPLRSARSP